MTNQVFNMAHINQNAAVSGTQHANAQVRGDANAFANLMHLEEQSEEIAELRPTEETAAASDEREGDGKEEREESESGDDSDAGEIEPDVIEKNDDGEIVHLNIAI